ncbi:MAG: hypothetical protein RLZZ216_1465 [Cyanobacteriota bacterium]|jgi:hypothetical protein
MFALLALATGVFADPLGLAFGSVRIQVKHPGPPEPFTLHVRTKETKEAQWEYIDKLQHFPVVLYSSPTGRTVRLSLPHGLKRYSQVCARMGPPPAPQSSFQLQLSIMSCANLPRRSPVGAWGGWEPSIIHAAL